MGPRSDPHRLWRKLRVSVNRLRKALWNRAHVIALILFAVGLAVIVAYTCVILRIGWVGARRAAEWVLGVRFAVAFFLVQFGVLVLLRVGWGTAFLVLLFLFAVPGTYWEADARGWDAATAVRQALVYMSAVGGIWSALQILTNTPWPLDVTRR